MDVSVNQKLLDRLRLIYPKAGFLYVITNPLWPENVYKIGRTYELKQRFHGYNTPQPEDIVVKGLFICTDVYAVEDEVKKRIVNYRYRPTKKEFACLPLADLLILIKGIIIQDPILTREYSTTIWKKQEEGESSTYGDQIYAEELTFPSEELKKCTLIKHGSLLFIPPPLLSSTPMPLVVREEWKSDLLPAKVEKKKKTSERKIFIPPTLESLRSTIFPSSTFSMLTAQKSSITKRCKENKKMEKLESPGIGVYHDPILGRWVGDAGCSMPGRRKYFSIQKFGNEKALQLAVDWRANGASKLKALASQGLSLSLTSHSPTLSLLLTSHSPTLSLPITSPPPPNLPPTINGEALLPLAIKEVEDRK